MTKNYFKLLSKGAHTFCSHCLEKLFAKSKEINCPMCRVLNDVSFENLQKNRTVFQVLECFSDQIVEGKENNE